MTPIQRKTNGIIVKALREAYPGGLTDKFLSSLLYSRGILLSRERLHREHLQYLMDRGYVEREEKETPVLGPVERFRLTEKGVLLTEGGDVDRGVEIPEE